MDTKKISLEELNTLINGGGKFNLLDVNIPEFYNEKHMPAALNAPVYEVTFLDSVKSLNLDASIPTIVYGTSARSRAADVAAGKMLRAGYENILVFEGGIEEWENAGLELARGSKDPLLYAKLEDREYIVDLGESVVYWTGKSAKSRHIGTLNVKSGGFTARGGTIVSGEFAIDMKSIKDIDLEDSKWNSILVSHLKSDDFFFAEKYPESLLTIKSAVHEEGVGEYSPHYGIRADLRIRDVTKEVDFPALIGIREDGSISVRLHFDFDRTEWNVLYGSEKFFEHLGIHLVDEYVGIDAHVIAK